MYLWLLQQVVVQYDRFLKDIYLQTIILIYSILNNFTIPVTPKMKNQNTTNQFKCQSSKFNVFLEWKKSSILTSLNNLSTSINNLNQGHKSIQKIKCFAFCNSKFFPHSLTYCGSTKKNNKTKSSPIALLGYECVSFVKYGVILKLSHIVDVQVLLTSSNSSFSES